jgi:hypothetical protein
MEKWKSRKYPGIDFRLDGSTNLVSGVMRVAFFRFPVNLDFADLVEAFDLVKEEK